MSWRKVINEEKDEGVEEVSGPYDMSLKSLAFQHARQELVAVHRALTRRGIVAVLSSSSQRSIRVACRSTWLEVRVQDSVLFTQRAEGALSAWSATDGVETFHQQLNDFIEQLLRDVKAAP